MSEQHELKSLELVEAHTPSVEVIETVANPINDHLSASLGFLYNSIRSHPCSRSTAESTLSSRLAISALLHAWFAMEASVNMGIYQLLFNENSSSYIPHKNRSAYDRKICKDFQKSLSFIDRIDYLRNGKTCCDKIGKNLGKIRQYEKLRNALVHGYVHPKETLLEERPGSRKKSTNEDGNTVIVTEFSTKDQVISSHKGTPIDIKKDFEELGLNHHYSEICCHDSYSCVWVAIVILNWMDRHYGIVTTANWNRDDKIYRFESRELNAPSGVRPMVSKNLIGTNALIKDINALVIQNKDTIIRRRIVSEKLAMRSKRRKK